MLKEILKLINDGKKDLYEMANLLAISKNQVKERIEMLVSMNYISVIDPTTSSCSGGCIGCSNSCACSSNHGLKIYSITKKGFELIS